MASLKDNYAQLKVDLFNVRNTARLSIALPQFFRQRITLPQARAGIKELLDSRVERFLGLARAQIYGRKNGPYQRLLKHAGCEFSDLESRIRAHGLQDTLVKLAAEGVYFTSDEFKGKTDVVRGNFFVSCFPAGLRPSRLIGGDCHTK